MSPRVLSRDQIEQFVELGYTKLERAFPREAAEAAQDFLWGKLAERGIRRDDRASRAGAPRRGRQATHLSGA